MVPELRDGGKDFGSKISEETPNGERPIAEDPARGKERRRGARGIRVKGFASRGEYPESRIEYEYEYEHEEGGEEDAGEISNQQNKNKNKKREGGLSAFSIPLSPITLHKAEMRLEHEHEHEEENL